MAAICYLIGTAFLFVINVEYALGYGSVQYNTQNVAPGQVKLTPGQCQNHQVTSFNTDAALRNCHGNRNARVESACIKLCALHSRGVIVAGGYVSEAAVNAYVEETYPYWTWDRIKHGIKACSGQLVEDGNDQTCLRSKRYLDCFENVGEYVCRESPPAVIPPHPQTVKQMEIDQEMDYAQQVAYAQAAAAQQQQGGGGLLGGLLGGGDSGGGLLGGILGGGSGGGGLLGGILGGGSSGGGLLGGILGKKKK